MIRAVLCTVYFTFTVVFANGDFFDGFMSGNRSELAVVIDLSDGNLAKVKEFWSKKDIDSKGTVLFEVLDSEGA